MPSIRSAAVPENSSKATTFSTQPTLREEIPNTTIRMVNGAGFFNPSSRDNFLQHRVSEEGRFPVKKRGYDVVDLICASSAILESVGFMKR